MSATITDRDLIAGAAAAIGLHWSRYDLAKLLHYGHSITADMLWNPLHNSAHAFELCLGIKAAISYDDDVCGRPCVFCQVDTERGAYAAIQPLAGDAPAALRRALTELAYDVAQAGGAA